MWRNPPRGRLRTVFNNVILTGRLTADPELKTTQSGVSVTGFSVAVERPYKSGEERLTDFINIVAWRHTAEFVTRHFKKGSMIGIEGRIQTRRYTDSSGINRTAFEVVANNVQFAESRRAEEARADGIAGSLAAGRREAEDAEQETKVSAADDRFIEIDNYDLPF